MTALPKKAGLASFRRGLSDRLEELPGRCFRWYIPLYSGVGPLGDIALSVVVVLGAMAALRIVGNISLRLSSRYANRRPTIQKIESSARFIIYVISAGVCVSLSIRLDSTALTVIGGALAFAVGFAMRDLVAAFIAGITIMFDRPFQVGDRVTYAGEYGDIIKIGLRSVRMNTLDHNIITIPNNKVLTDVTSSGNYGALEMQVAMDFYIGVDQDAKLAAELIREACLISPYVFLDQPIPILAKQVILQDYVAVYLKARPYVFDSSGRIKKTPIAYEQNHVKRCPFAGSV